MSWRSIALAATIVAIATAASIAGPLESSRDTLRLSVSGDPHTLMPLLVTSAVEAQITKLLFEPLFEQDSHNRLVPDLALVIPTRSNGGISADGCTITMRLRQGVSWQDGAPFTAADVVFSINSILDAKNAIANRELYANIQSVDAPARYVARFRLKKPQSSFLNVIADGYEMAPAHLLETSANLATDPFNAMPVGTGAYTLVRWVRGDHIELAANAIYFRGAPKIAHITISIVPSDQTRALGLRTHAIDFSTVNPTMYDQLRDAPGLLRSIEPQNYVFMLALNTRQPLLQDVRVRQAISKAVSRKRILQTAMHDFGNIAYGDLPLFMYDGHPPSGWDDGDPAGARNLLDEAGWNVGLDGVRTKNGVPLLLQFISPSGSASGESIDLQVMQMLRDVGIGISYKTFSTSLYYEPASAGGPLFGGTFDIAGMGVGGNSDPTNDELFGCASRIPDGFNTAGYCSAEMERLQGLEQREYDPVRRNAIISKIEALAVADSPYVFLYHPARLVVYDATLERPPASLNDAWYHISTWSFMPR